MSKLLILGIDLGTTNSLAAVFKPGGPVVIEDAAGQALVPSVIAFSEDSKSPAGGEDATLKITVGSEARAHAVENPTATVFSVKRLIGKTIDDVREDLSVLPYAIVAGPKNLACVNINGHIRTPQELSAIILGEIRDRAEAILGRKVTEAVVTVPAYFDDAQRQATREAGRLAGLDVRRIVNEPTAAALAYGLDRKKEEIIAVYDFGGGTFDVSILQVSGGVFQVLSTNGDTRLGGDDLDREIINLVTGEIRQRFGEELAFPPATRQALRNLAEAVKIKLSSEDHAAIAIDLGNGRSFERTITVEEFESLAGRWVDHTIEHCIRAMDDAGLTSADIAEVVMVGGSTRIPLVRRRVAEVFGREPYTAIDPDRVVALGAAVQAGILAGASRETLLLDVTPLSMGIETLGGAMGKLIMRNSTIPCSAAETFTTYVDGQTSVDINILQGERELAKDCRELGRFQLRNIPPMPAGAPRVKVTFVIDANGILNVSARETRSGREATVQVTPAYGLTKDDIDTMVKDSYTHAIEDMTQHRLIDVRNEVNRVLVAIDKALVNAGDILTDQQRETLDAAVADCRAKQESCEDPDELYASMKAANDAAAPLTQAQMDAVLSQAFKGRAMEDLGPQISKDEE